MGEAEVEVPVKCSGMVGEERQIRERGEKRERLGE